jgi:hypothetical protein
MVIRRDRDDRCRRWPPTGSHWPPAGRSGWPLTGENAGSEWVAAGDEFDGSAGGVEGDGTDAAEFAQGAGGGKVLVGQVGSRTSASWRTAAAESASMTVA